MDLLKDKPLISLSIKQVSVDEAMNAALKNQALSYAVKGMTIILQKKAVPFFMSRSGWPVRLY